MNKEFKSGFLAIIGRPNVGKSTLLNALIGRKIAIMSDKPQTTRNEVMGILTREEFQMVFIDTPGVHKPKNSLGEFMMDAVRKNLKNVDVVLYMVDAGKAYGKGEEYIINLLKEIRIPVILVINKIDCGAKEEILPVIQEYSGLIEARHIIPISALKKENLEELLDKILENLDAGPMYFPKEDTSNVSETVLVSEIIREKVLFLTEEEVPHSVAVVIDLIEEEGDLVNVYASIFVERKSQKGLLIGKQGSMLKRIGRMARLELEKLWGMKVYLNIQIKVREGWRRRDTDIRDFGYRREK